MTEYQRQRILDVMHTLRCIQDGKVHDPKHSVKACWEVLQEVLDIQVVKQPQ